MEKLHGTVMGAAVSAMQAPRATPTPKTPPVQQPQVIDGKWTDSGRPEWRGADGGFIGYADGLPNTPTRKDVSS